MGQIMSSINTALYNSTLRSRTKTLLECFDRFRSASNYLKSLQNQNIINLYTVFDVLFSNLFKIYRLNKAIFCPLTNSQGKTRSKTPNSARSSVVVNFTFQLKEHVCGVLQFRGFCFMIATENSDTFPFKTEVTNRPPKPHPQPSM